MRFSIKWILASTLYVALATASFARGEWYFADALWALTLLAVAYGIVVALFAKGRRRGC